MKKIWLSMLTMALSSSPVLAQQGDEKSKNETQEKKIEIKVESKVTGKAITIGSDGKVEVKEFSGDSSEGGARLEGLSEAMKKKVEEAMKKAKAAQGENSSKTESAQIFLHGALGNVTIVGPDGKVTTQALTLSGSPGDDVAKILLKLDGISDEVKEKLKDALKKTDGSKSVKGFQFQVIKPDEEPKGNVEKRDSQSKSDAVLSKLDLILQRLDKLEKEVAELKAK